MSPRTDFCYRTSSALLERLVPATLLSPSDPGTGSKVLDDKLLALQGDRRGQAHLKTYDGGYFFTMSTRRLGHRNSGAGEVPGEPHSQDAPGHCRVRRHGLDNGGYRPWDKEVASHQQCPRGMDGNFNHCGQGEQDDCQGRAIPSNLHLYAGGEIGADSRLRQIRSKDTL